MNTEYTCPACGTPLTSEDEKCPRCNKVEQPVEAVPATENTAETAETPPMSGVAQEGTSQPLVVVRCRMFLGVPGNKQVTVIHGMLLVILMMLVVSTYLYGCDFVKYYDTKSEAATIFTVYNGFMAFFCAYTLVSAITIRANGLYLLRYYYALRFFSAIGYLYVYSKLANSSEVFFYAFELLALLLLMFYLAVYEQPKRVYPSEGRRHYYYDIILFLAICVMQILYFNDYLHLCRTLAGYGINL